MYMNLDCPVQLDDVILTLPDPPVLGGAGKEVAGRSYDGSSTQIKSPPMALLYTGLRASQRLHVARKATTQTKHECLRNSATWSLGV